jgi:hypothetical protein
LYTLSTLFVKFLNTPYFNLDYYFGLSLSQFIKTVRFNCSSSIVRYTYRWKQNCLSKRDGFAEVYKFRLSSVTCCITVKILRKSTFYFCFILLLFPRVFLYGEVCQQTSPHRTTSKTNKRMLPHSHDYHMKILNDFNKVQVTPRRWSVVIETCRSF